MMSTQRVIAVEEHFATPEYLEAVAGLAVWPGDETEMNLMRGLEHDGVMRDKLADPGTRLREMDASGTDMAVLSLNPPGLQPYDRQSAVPLARDVNDGLVEIIRRWSARFAGLGTVAPQDPAQAAQEIERIMGPLGLGGVMIPSHTQGRCLDEPEFEPILAAAEALRALVPAFPCPPPADAGPV